MWPLLKVPLKPGRLCFVVIITAPKTPLQTPLVRTFFFKKNIRLLQWLLKQLSRTSLSIPWLHTFGCKMGLVSAAARVPTFNCGNYAFKLCCNRVICSHFIILHFLSPTPTADGVNSAEYDGEEGLWGEMCRGVFTGCRQITDYNVSTWRILNWDSNSNGKVERFTMFASRCRVFICTLMCLLICIHVASLKEVKRCQSKCRLGASGSPGGK